MESFSWKKVVKTVTGSQLANVVEEVVSSRGGTQLKDPAYNSGSRVAQPSDPPPPHLYQQQQSPQYQYQQIHGQGESSSYFSGGNPSSPFIPSNSSPPYSPPYSPPSHQGSSFAQGYPLSLQSHSSSHLQPSAGYDPHFNQGQGYAQQESGYGGGTYLDPTASYHSITPTPSSYFQTQADDSQQHGAGGHNFNDDSSQGLHPYPPHTPSALQRSQTSYDDNCGYGTGSGYDSPPAPLDQSQRSYTMPVEHDCIQSWNRYSGQM
ncbi:hypothetical protein K505DRAFT_413703 [Melanomma pulvis-pyrius CBS 109.77]|uniref:Uncharacterized protein n=1 Tax=Melanomma pulvis-pyrius CBS 109.77 TaxID=1314802 RepID=A0A6A6XUG2_9PLEO|nr:hypothetical protein K505DRAFT_413703 [Melanomma pulvis-pyrius CBS 109.77]